MWIFFIKKKVACVIYCVMSIELSYTVAIKSTNLENKRRAEKKHDGNQNMLVHAAQPPQAPVPSHPPARVRVHRTSAQALQVRLSVPPASPEVQSGTQPGKQEI